MKIILIRHAESENNLKLDMPKELYNTIRNEDPNITEKGRIQSEKLGFYLLKKKLNLKKIFCSAMVRSLETSKIIQKLIRVDVEVKVNIHEKGGVYNGNVGAKGKTRSWIHENYPTFHVPNDVTEDGWFRHEAKETVEEAYVRARGLISELKKWSQEEVFAENEYVGLVTHGAFMDILMAILLERKEDSKLKLTHANTGLTSFEFKKDGTYRMIYINMAEHLEEDFSVLALENHKESTLEDSKAKEEKEAGDELPPSHNIHHKHRSASTGYNLNSQMDKYKSDFAHKKDLKTNEEIEDMPIYNRLDSKKVLPPIEEGTEKGN